MKKNEIENEIEESVKALVLKYPAADYEALVKRFKAINKATGVGRTWLYRKAILLGLEALEKEYQ